MALIIIIALGVVLGLAIFKNPQIIVIAIVAVVAIWYVGKQKIEQDKAAAQPTTIERSVK